MTIKNHYFQSITDLNKNLDLSSIDTDKTLLQIFSGLIKEPQLKELVDILKTKNNQVKFIGTTTAGEIYNGQVGSEGIAVSIMSFNDTEVNTAHFEDDDEFILGEDIAKEMFESDTKAMILFIDGLLTNGSNVIDGIASINNTIPIAGGMAGDNGNVAATFVVDQNGVYNKGAVVATLQSDNLEVHTDYQLNWHPIGKTMTVTKAEGTRLYELDGVSVSDVYTKYLGKNIGDNLPHSAIEFPLIKLDENGLEVCRTFVHRFEDGSLQTIGNIFEGDKVKFAFGNINLVIDTTEQKTSELYSYYPEAIFTYSCASRITFMQSEVIRELEPLNRIAPIAGFFTYGEIFHRGGKNHLLNISLTILMLSEKQTKQTVQTVKKESLETKREQNFFKGKHFLVLDALTNLTTQVISELNESKDEIEKSHKNTKDSIEYASIIQQAIVPNSEVLNSYFKDSFVYLQQRDIVGGDIYFISELDTKDEIVIMVIDGAGHGVPGGFITILVKAIETQIMADISSGKLKPSPAKILECFNYSIKTMLKQEKGSKSNSGFDGGVLYYNKKANICKYAGAKTPLYLVDKDNFEVIKSDRKHVGFARTSIDQQYTEYDIEVKEGRRIYISTDGLIDQELDDGTRYGKTKFEELLKSNSEKPFDKQKEIIEKLVEDQKKSKPQSDDITVVGFKF